MEKEEEKMRVRVWLKGHEDQSFEMDLKGLITEPLFPINVKDYLCRMGFFSWADYNRIKYKVVKNG